MPSDTSSKQSPEGDASQVQAKTYYDDFSGWYERERSRGYHVMLDDIEVAVAEPFARDKDILEMGCGTGLIMRRLAPLAKSAKGVDISPGMIELSKERGLDVQLGSVTELPFEDASFDLVYSFKVLAHIPDIGLAISEAARVTRPGGHMLLEFYNPLSLRYAAKRIAGPQRISETRTEADMYTRWDSAFVIPKLLPPNVELKGFRGVRVLTPAAFVHRVPVVGAALRRAESLVVDTPLRYFGGFLIAVLQRVD